LGHVVFTPLIGRDEETGGWSFVIWQPDGGWRKLIGVPIGIVLGILALPLVAVLWLFARTWDRTPAEMLTIVDAIMGNADFDPGPFDSAHDAWFAAQLRNPKLEALRREGNRIAGPPFDAEALTKWADIRERLKALAATTGENA
jgi:hypothetical protein